MKKIIIACTFLTIVTTSYTQSINKKIQTDSISITKTFGGYHFYQGKERLNLNQLTNIMKENEEAYHIIKMARSTNTVATILGFAGGFMVGWTIGTSLRGDDPNWAIAGIGVGLIGIAIPVNQKFNKQAKQAVKEYNSSLKAGTFWQNSELKFQVTGNKIGFALNF